MRSVSQSVSRSGLFRFGPICASMDLCAPVSTGLNCFELDWSGLNQSGQILSSLKWSGLVFTGQDQSVPVKSSLNWTELV